MSSDELGKLSTIDTDAPSICRSQLDAHPHLVLIDGEHTNTAAFSDFLAIFPLIATNALVTFHDANLVWDAVQIIERLLVHWGMPHALIIPPSCVAVFGFGDFISLLQTELARRAEERSAYFAATREQRHRAVADAVIERTDGLRAHSIAELIAWTARTEQMRTAAETITETHAANLQQALDQGGDLKAEVARLRRALSWAEAANAEKQSNLDALITSTSWRLTAPMRAVLQVLKRRRK